MITVVLVLVAGAVLLVGLFERQQLEQIDERLAATTRVLESVSSAPPSMPVESAREALVQLVDGDGAVLFAPERLEGRPAMRSVDPEGAAAPVGATLEGIGPVRVAAVPFGDDWLLYAESTQGVEDAVRDLTVALVIGVPIVAVVLGALVWLVVGLALRPVQEAMERERRLVADVSHELRTPLAGARALLESESQIPAEIELNRLEALAALTRLESMADDLLVEARTDGTGARRLDELVDLDDVVLRVLTLAPHRGVEVDATGVSGGQVRGNGPALERMVANLLANAVRHADSRVRLELTEHDDLVRLVVADDGPGVAPEDRARVFERFTRLDDARARDGAGAGLGLPIVLSVVAAHGGTIEVEDADLGGAAFIVTLPAAAGAGQRLAARRLSTRP
jgi:signal transduction histidine kinase